MGKVINLRTIRKQKNREAIATKIAQATRVSDVKKVELNRVINLNDRVTRQFDGHKFDKED